MATPWVSLPYVMAAVPADLVICLVLAPLFLSAQILPAHERNFFSLPFCTPVDRLAPPVQAVPSSLAVLAGLRTLAFDFLATAAASLSFDATTVDLATETCSASLSWNECTTWSIASASLLRTNLVAPRTETVRSSTYSVSRTVHPHALCVSSRTSSSRSLSSEVAKPEPAVMPRVASTFLEKPPSMPMVRESL